MMAGQQGSRTADADVLHDLRRRRRALDVLAIACLAGAAIAWAWSHDVTPLPCKTVVIDPIARPVVEPVQVVTPVELVDDGEVHPTR